MGEIAEMMLNGDMDEETGEWLDGGMGFPRSPSRDRREREFRLSYRTHGCPSCGKRFASFESSMQHQQAKSHFKKVTP